MSKPKELDDKTIRKGLYEFRQNLERKAKAEKAVKREINANLKEKNIKGIERIKPNETGFSLIYKHGFINSEVMDLFASAFPNFELTAFSSLEGKKLELFFKEIRKGELDDDE